MSALYADRTPSGSERKIDHIDRRLEVVVSLLQDLKAQLSPKPSHVSSPGSDPTAASGPSIKLTPPVASPPCPSPSHRSEGPPAPVVEGDSSLTAHSTFANDVLHKVVGRLEDPSRILMGDTLDTLRQLVDAMKEQSASHEMAYPNAQSFALPASAMLKGLELPPIEKSVKVLSLARGQY
jgi:hypothetical protein